VKDADPKNSKAYLSRLNSEGVRLVASGIVDAWKTFRSANPDEQAVFRILDVGCGDGSYWRIVQDHWQAHGTLPPHALTLVDISEVCGEECEENQLPQSAFHCARFPFTEPVARSLGGPKFDLVVFSAVFHELRLQAAIDRLGAIEDAAPLSVSEIVENIFSNLSQQNLLSDSASVLIGDLVHQSYWHLDALNLAREWQSNNLPKYLGIGAGGHADPAFAFLTPQEIVGAVTNTKHFILEDHKECQSLPEEFRNLPAERYTPYPAIVRSVVRSREFFLLTFRYTVEEEVQQVVQAYNISDRKSQVSFHLKLLEPLKSLRKALEEPWNESRVGEIEQIFRNNIGGSKATLFSTTVDGVTRAVNDMCLLQGIAPPRLMSLWPSLKSKMLEALGMPHRFLTTSVFGRDYDGVPFVSSEAGITCAKDWVSICYELLFLRQNFAFSDKWIDEHIRFPYLFDVMLRKDRPAPYSLALVVLPTDAIKNAEFCERIRELLIARPTSTAKPGHWVLGLEPPNLKTTPLSNANRIDSFFGRALSGENQELKNVHLSILELYLDFLFACAGKADISNNTDTLERLNETWGKAQYFKDRQELQKQIREYNNGGNPILPVEFRQAVQSVLKELSQFSKTAKNPPAISAWHLIPGTSFLNPSHVTGNLMILSDSVLPAKASAKIRELHDEMLNLFQRVDDEAVLIRTNFLQRQQAIKSARAAIMSRNLSHNVGSHTLANSRFFESIGVLHEARTDSTETKTLEEGAIFRARQRLARFNGFIQGRLDFIARALGEGTSMAEPMFFFGDLFQGFLSQEVLLNTLLSDNGVTIREMQFRLRLPNMKEDAIFQGKKSEDDELRHLIFQESGEGVQDLLIALPGGMVGRHAFYAFLENIMRNAAKYGDGPKDKLVVRLEVRKGMALDRKTNDSSECYYLEVTDSRSTDIKGDVAGKVRKYLNQPIIQDDGQARNEGHGIQEMKVCAGFLAGEDFAFPTDSAVKSRQPAKLVDDSYLQYLNSDDDGLREAEAWVTQTDNSLQAWPQSVNQDLAPVSSGPKQLHYRLILQKPVIFGIVNLCESPDAACPPIQPATDNDAVVFYRDIETLATNPAHFGLLLSKDDDKARIQSLLGKIADFHTALPYRLMVVVPEESLLISWRTEITAMVQSGSLPVRRVHVVACADLFKNADGTFTPMGLEDIPSFISNEKGADSGVRLFKTIYEEWLKAWKGSSSAEDGKFEPWHLWIGFQRTSQGTDTSSIAEKWRGLSEFKSDVARVVVSVKGSDGSRKRMFCGNRPPGTEANGNLMPPDLKHLVVYDNHREAFSEIQDPIKGGVGLAKAPLCYHAFSGSGQIELFHCLETPPTDPFGLAFLLFSLLEASLLNVAVVDERVAEAMIEEDLLFQSRHGAMFHSGIFPLFQIRHADDDSHFLSPAVEEAVKRVDEELAKIGGHGNRRGKWAPDPIEFSLGSEEGLFVSEKRDTCRAAPGVYQGKKQVGKVGDKKTLSLLSYCTSEQQSGLDALVVHEGIIDAVRKKWGDSIPRLIHDGFWGSVPCVIRTSGRGSQSRHDGNHLPFLEFSELSQSTYQSHNKLALGRSLLALRGKTKRK
jgi:hypothetical protein